MRISDWSSDVCSSDLDADDALSAQGEAVANVAAARAALEAAQIDLGFTRIVAPIGGRIGRSAFTPGALVTTGQAAPLATIQTLDPIYVDVARSEAHTSELQSIMRNSYTVFFLKNTNYTESNTKEQPHR